MLCTVTVTKMVAKTNKTVCPAKWSIEKEDQLGSWFCHSPEGPAHPLDDQPQRSRLRLTEPQGAAPLEAITHEEDTSSLGWLPLQMSGSAGVCSA